MGALNIVLDFDYLATEAIQIKESGPPTGGAIIALGMIEPGGDFDLFATIDALRARIGLERFELSYQYVPRHGFVFGTINDQSSIFEFIEALVEYAMTFDE
jgi:hypothetical protein